jgi:carbohydrate-binding DOMON domain-containing protein
VLGLSFPDDVVYDMAKELKVDITKIAGKLKATELVIAPLSTFESLRKLFRDSFASKQELRLSHITSLMARAGPYTLHPDVVVEVRPGPKCDPAIHRTIAVLLPTNAPATAPETTATTATTTTTATASAIRSAGASSAVKVEETVTTYVEENGVVVIPE